MPLSIIDVIDSAVKIGLGAAISAFSTYKATKSNHENERTKELRSHKIKTIEMIAERCEAFVNAYVGFKNALSGALHRRATDDGFILDKTQIDLLASADKALFHALEAANVAMARLSLMRAGGAKEELSKIIKLIAGIRNPAIQERKAPSLKFGPIEPEFLR